MAITHPTTVRNALANLIDDQVNAGSTYGKLKLLTSGDSLLCAITLQDPAYGAAVTGTITLQGTPLEGTASGTGTIAKFTITDSDDNIIVQGSAAESGGDLTVDNDNVETDQTVRVTAHTYSAPN